MARNTKELHPDLQAVIPKFLTECRKQGLEVRITECYRSVAEQNALYAQGRTTPGNIVTNCIGSDYASPHQWGVAFDICRNDGSGAYNDKDGFFAKCGKIGQTLGLQWGGAWSDFVDKPHFQLGKFFDNKIQTVGNSKMKKQYGSPPAFKKSWGKSSISDNWGNLTAAELTARLKANKTYPTAKIKSKCNFYKQTNIVNGKYNSFKTGDEVEYIKDLGNGWSNVRYHGNIGFVKNTSINKTNLSKYKKGIINTKVYLRTGMKISKSTLLPGKPRIPKGKSIPVVSVIGKWCQIRYTIDGKRQNCYIVKRKITL